MHKTHFGYQEVNPDEKTKLVHDVFHRVANKYDVMNDVMSFGLHRLWKRFTVLQTHLKEGDFVLDIASGTGDLAKIFAKKIGKTGRLILTDINESMLKLGKTRLIDAGLINNIYYVQADAEHLPFTHHYFDCITIAFGLRNVTNQVNALKSLYDVLKPGGTCSILEFSHPKLALLNKLYDQYSFHVIPKLGEWIAHDRKSYEYLVESIRMHPDQETLKVMMQNAGFEDVHYFNLSGGIVALHQGYKY